MKILKISAIVLVVILGLLLAIVAFQPATAHLEKSIVINGSADVISNEISRFQSFDAWSPWSKISPEVKYTVVIFKGFEGTFCSRISLDPEGNGTKVTWVYEGINDGLKGKAMWMLMKGRMNDQYEKGLAALKVLIEEMPPAVQDED